MTSPKRWIGNVFLSLAVLLVGAGATLTIFRTEPKATRVGATKETAMLVEVVRAQRDTFAPVITAMGTVTPAEDLILRPRVNGVVVKRSEMFTPGGFVKKGHTLLRIEPADYQNVLAEKMSELERAIADLNIEMGRQKVAEKEYALLSEPLAEKNRTLVLREPQLKAAKAKVEAARTAVAQAELDLKRTRIKVPFDAHILSRNVNVGSQVSPGDDLGRLVGVDTYWVETTVPVSKLRWLTFPKGPDEIGSRVRIRHDAAWPEGVYRQGRLYKLLGSLEAETRMARVLVSVEDPLGYRSNATDEVSTLMIGAYVNVEIQAKPIKDVFRIRRDYVRKGDTVWLKKDGRLEIRPVRIAFRDDRFAYIQKGLKESDEVVTTNLSTVVAGAKLRVAHSSSKSGPRLETRRDAGAPTGEPAGEEKH